MPADVNVTEKMARAMWASWNPHGPRWHQTDDRSREETRAEARKALGVLADPDVLDGIAGVLREHGAAAIREGNTSRGGLIHNERVCEGCGYELPWHSWRDGLADHAAAAVVEWLRGERP